MTTIEQAKIQKAKLEQEIASSLKVFTEQTGLTVNRLDVNPVVTLGGVIAYYGIDVDVSL